MQTTKTAWLTMVFLSVTLAGVLPAHAYYDPGAQRWLNRDPVGERGGLNLYAYVENNPVNEIDPLGLSMGSATLVLEPTLVMSEEAAAAYNAALARAAARAAAAAAALANTSFCKQPKDPCKGLRNQLNEHIKKLADYVANPDASDNKDLLKHPKVVGNPDLRDKIIDSRIKILQRQIANFKKQVEDCEKANGM